MAVKLIIIYRTKNARNIGWVWSMVLPDGEQKRYTNHTYIPNLKIILFLTETEALTMSSRPKNWKYARNKNILVIGGSGSGKQIFVKPNIMQ